MKITNQWCKQASSSNQRERQCNQQTMKQTNIGQTHQFLISVPQKFSLVGYSWYDRLGHTLSLASMVFFVALRLWDPVTHKFQTKKKTSDLWFLLISEIFTVTKVSCYLVCIEIGSVIFACFYSQQKLTCNLLNWVVAMQRSGNPCLNVSCYACHNAAAWLLPFRWTRWRSLVKFGPSTILKMVFFCFGWAGGIESGMTQWNPCLVVYFVVDFRWFVGL